jgi:predicted DCC family thiol-disulfide oxidoreductase YuxK
VSSARAVLFDDDCGFCTRSVRLFRSLDWLRRVEWVPRNDPATTVRFPQVSGERTTGEMVSIRPDGCVNGGYFAIRDILLRLPLTFLPALIMYIPGVPFVGVPAYRCVARNRHRFGGTTACAVKK